MNELLDKLKAYLSAEELALVERAYQFSAYAHRDHKRLSGEPYITHPLAVAGILADLEQDAMTICAALLHDVLEDAGITREQLAETFNAEIARLVEGVTKLSKISFVSREEKQAENFRKMFVAMGEDYRIIVIKLADRLHNMKTLQYLTPTKQKETALETREIFAPLAHRMGMWRLKWELEDLAFMYLEPAQYAEIRRKVSESRASREEYIDNFIAMLSRLLTDNKIKAEIKGRAKHFYSIFRKMVDHRLEFEDIYDLMAVRVITDKVHDCYDILGLVHDAWRPIPGRFRDYIAMPKSNGYQSLHTTVMAPGGRPVEIQIRTREMHRTAEYGVAAHWRYKEGKTDALLDQKMAWFRQMLEWQSEMKDSSDFLASLKVDLMVEEIFAFTPKGDVFALPPGATPVDFAYRIHTEVGHRCVGAKVNGRIVPLDRALQNGDIVEIITGKKDAPSRDWLGFIKTTGARVKIKNWIKRQRSEEPVAEGGTLPLPEKGIAKVPVASRRKGKGKNAVRVSGLENVLVRFSKCCYPLPFEKIVGFVSKGRGIAIHRADCANLGKAEKGSSRTVDVSWVADSGQYFPVALVVEAFDRVGIFKDVLGQISEGGTNISSARVDTRRGGVAFLFLVVEVKDTEQLERVIGSIKKIADVYEVTRK